MSTIREIDLDQDYPVLVQWWQRHGALPCPREVLPQGYMVTAGGVDIAAAFLYLDVGGKLAMVEWLTTNPAVSYSRYLVDDVTKLIRHIEDLAIARGCVCMLSMVKPGSGESRFLKRLDYIPPVPDDPPHVMYAKSLRGVP